MLPQPVSSNFCSYFQLSLQQQPRIFIVSAPSKSWLYLFVEFVIFFNRHCIQKGPDALVNCFEPNFGSPLLSQLIVMISNVRPKYLNYCIYFINAAL